MAKTKPTHFEVEKAHAIAQDYAGACGNGAGEYTDQDGWTYTVQLPTSIPADILKGIAWLAEYGYGYPANLMATISVRDPAGHLWGSLGDSTVVGDAIATERLTQRGRETEPGADATPRRAIYYDASAKTRWSNVHCVEDKGEMK